MKDTVSHYHRYMRVFHPGEPEYSRKQLFYTIRKNVCSPISDDTVRAFMNGYAKTAHVAFPEVPEKIHPHIFRHSRAMHLYQHGMDLTMVSQWLIKEEKQLGFIALYGSRRLVIRGEFEKYLEANPEIKEGLKNANRKNKDTP